MNKVVIFGTGDIAQIANHFLAESDDFEVVAFTVDKEFIESNEFEGKPVHPFEEIEKAFSPGEYKLFIAVSYAKVNRVREDAFKRAKAKGYELVTYIHPSASVASTAEIGENCFIFEDNTVQPYVKLGNNITLWSGNHIGHHSQLKDNCFITSHVVISGGCTIGENSFIGVNATLRDHITIGKYCVIGAGAIIMGNTKDKEVYVPERTRPFKKNSDEIKL